MLDPQSSRFWQAVLLSDLMDAERLKACWNAIPPEKREAPEHIDRRLARQAVHAKELTLWQAQQLLAGRTSGFRVDRYVLLDMIGQGGMGRVYLATDSRLNRRVALKILSPERVNNPRAVARFQREARVGAQLQHENLVRIYDFGESSGRYYLVMEYIEGKTIGTLISEQGPIPPATAVRLVRQVASGLDHAHQKGLIHRDVNPYNILVTRDGIAKLADLGLAINLAEDDRVTREGATVGTFDYVAPEQARHSHSADIRSDIYSLGCTLYHMISGQVPFPSPSLPEKLFAHQAMDPTPLDKLMPGLSPGLAAVVGRMMRKSPDERYATPFLVAQALEPFESESRCVEAGKELAGPIRQPTVEPVPRSPQFFDELPQFATRAPAVLVEAVAAPVTLQAAAARHTDAGPSSAPRNDTAKSPGSMPTPASDATVSDPDFPVLVDLGPEPSLSEGLLRSKPRFSSVFSTTTGSVATPNTPVSNPETSTAETLARPLWPFPIWGWGLFATTVAAIVLTVILASVRTWGPNSQTTANKRPAKSKDAPDGDSSDSAASRTDWSTRPPITEQPFVVRLPDDEERHFDNLLAALQIATSNRGYVELRNREPYRLHGDQLLDFSRGTQAVAIRAAPGFEPVIEIDLKGPSSFITTGSSVSLELSGVTILVHYPETGASSPPPPIIKAARKARIDRCAFKIASGSRRKDSRAIFFEGNVLEVNRCWFEGFDEAIELSLLMNSTARIQQTMIVPASGLTPPAAQFSEWHGWGVQARLISEKRSQTRKAHLTLDHCTVEGAGVLDVVGSLSPAVFQVEVKQCAIKAEALLACRAGKAGEDLSARVRWSGTGNQYDILGRSWIVLSAHQGTPELSTAVVDLNSWLDAVGTESKPIKSKLTYQTDPKERSLQLQPRDFAIKNSEPPQNQPGADPDLVGPWSKP